MGKRELMMFDPTSFENMKVVFEGIFYDKDLGGEITIIDRNDLMNMAKLSRSYDLSFQLIHPYVQEPKTVCKVKLLSKLENLAAELIPFLTVKEREGAGCNIEIQYFYQYKQDAASLKKMNTVIKNIWEDGIVEHRATYDPFSNFENQEHHVRITFNSIIKEDEIDLFNELFQHIMTTLLQIEKLLK
jgi:hypothetical protein